MKIKWTGYKNGKNATILNQISNLCQYQMNHKEDKSTLIFDKKLMFLLLNPRTNYSYLYPNKIWSNLWKNWKLTLAAEIDI